MAKIEVAVNLKRTKNGYVIQGPLQKAAKRKLDSAIELENTQLVHMSFTTKVDKKASE